jgi:DnaJ-class molecular chaperone
MKIFTIIKVGYTAGVYGNSGEYFTLIVIDSEAENDFMSYHFHGQYGADDRIKDILKEAGFKQKYSGSYYGKMTRKDIPSEAFHSEYTLKEELKTELQKRVSNVKAQPKLDKNGYSCPNCNGELYGDGENHLECSECDYRIHEADLS